MRRIGRLWRFRRQSPSRQWAEAGRELTAAMARGAEQGARETEGMTWEERVRYVLANTPPEVLAHAEGVARRSFSALYEDEGDDDGQSLTSKSSAG